METARKTVLLVEDTEDFVKLVEVALKDAAYNVAHAWNGKEALVYLKNHHRPDVIILDIRMPEMDGWQFRAEQETDDRLREIPVLVYSCERNIAGIAARLHAAGYIAKSESPRRVLEAVERVCH